MSGKLNGRVVIITGAARGQGAAAAELFAAEGATVVLGDILDNDLAATAERIGDAAHPIHLDVTQEADWAAAVELATGLGPLRGLVNNAGILRRVPIEHETLDGFRRVLEVNLVGALAGMQAVRQPIIHAGGGSIVNVSSTAGMAGIPYHGAYGSSKWGLRGLTKVAALEWGHDGIRVNSIHPGPIETPMLPSPRNDGSPDTRFAHLPIGRAGQVDEVAQLTLFLISDASSFQTGTEFVIDGGGLAGPTPSYEWKP